MFAILFCLGGPAVLRAQTGTFGGNPTPSFGTMAMPTGQMFGTSPAAKNDDPGISITTSYVGFIDAAAPRNFLSFRFDGAYGNRQPMRAEYYHPKGGIPGGNGFPFMETKLDYQEITSSAEYSWTPWFSIFVEGPYRWINPEINANQSGAGDMRYGLKLCTWNSDSFIATILLRLYQPSARETTLGTGHWSVEPGLLLAYQLNEMIQFEGEVRYWIPITRDDFAGQLVRYGLGVSWGRRTSGMWYAPVGEVVGWTLFSGKTAVATSAEHFEIREAHGQTIVNAYLGVRWGHGPSLDFYAGYGRSLTGDFWQRDLFRIEARYSY